MKALRLYLPVLFALSGTLVSAETPAALKGQAWTKIAQDLAKDPFFQDDIKKTLASLPPDGKVSATKCIGLMMKGSGVMVTGTAIDAILAQELRAKVKAGLSDTDAKSLDEMSDLDFLNVAAGPNAKAVVEKKLPEKAQIVLDSDPASGVNTRDAGAVKLGKQLTRFRIVPGLADPTMVSFEQETGKNLFLRHFDFKFQVAQLRDSDDLFNDDCTFKIVRLAGDKVKVQSKNYPGKYMCVDGEGKLVLTEIETDAKAVFRFVESR